MSRASAALLLVAVLGLILPSPIRAAESPTAEAAKRAAKVRDRLSAANGTSSLDDPATPMGDVFRHISQIGDFPVEVNEAAFKADGLAGVQDITIGHEIHMAKGMSLGAFFRRVLTAIPAPSGATFVVRGGVVEITTRNAASPSHWRDENMPPPPDVSVEFDKRELQGALQEIADATGVNVVLDARAKDKGKTPVTLTLRDVAVDTAVRLLADMADLTAVPVDNVLYVTAKENAEALRKEQDKRRAAKAEEPKPVQGEPAPLKAETERLLKDNADSIRRIKEAVERQRQPEPAPNKDK